MRPSPRTELRGRKEKGTTNGNGAPDPHETRSRLQENDLKKQRSAAHYRNPCRCIFTVRNVGGSFWKAYRNAAFECKRGGWNRGRKGALVETPSECGSAERHVICCLYYGH